MYQKLANFRKVSKLLLLEELSNGRVTKLLKRVGLSVCPSLKSHTSRRKILQALNFQLLFSIVVEPEMLTVADIIGAVAYELATDNKWSKYLLKSSQRKCFHKLKEAKIFHSAVKTLIKESEQYKFPFGLLSSNLARYVVQSYSENPLSLFSIIVLSDKKYIQALVKTLAETPSKVYVLKDFVFVDDLNNEELEQRELVILEQPVPELEMLIQATKLSLV